MEIVLTPKQWEELKRIVAQGEAAERSLGKPIEVSETNTKIEIKETDVVINLTDGA